MFLDINKTLKFWSQEPKLKIIDKLKEYDDFIGYSSLIRSKAKTIIEYKKDIIDFVCSEDFKYIYDKKKDKVVIEMFFGKEILNKLYKNL